MINLNIKNIHNLFVNLNFGSLGINFSKCYHQMYKKKLWTIFRGLWGNDKSTIYRKIMSKTEQICRGRKSSDLNTIYFLSKSISSIFISSFFIGWFVSNRTGGRYPFVSKPFLRIWPVYFIEKKKKLPPSHGDNNYIIWIE